MDSGEAKWLTLINSFPASIKVIINSAMGANVLAMWLNVGEAALQGVVLIGSVVLVWLQVMELLAKRKARLKQEEKVDE